MIEPFEKPIYVTRPFLPPLEDFCKGLEEIWQNAWLTNSGPVLQRYSRALRSYFETENVCLFTNGTLALQIALQGMGISGEVITTPFTFVATTHALYWNKIRPCSSISSRTTIRWTRKKSRQPLRPGRRPFWRCTSLATPAMLTPWPISPGGTK